MKCFTGDGKNGEKVLEAQLKSLQEKIDALEKEKNESELIICELKTEIANIKNEKQVKIVERKTQEMKSRDTQTETEFQPNVVRTESGDILMFCTECEYPAEDIYELGEHMYEVHSSRYEGEEEEYFSCDL